MPPAPPGAVEQTRGTAEHTCRELALAWHAVDTRTDTSPQAARMRAARQWGTPELMQRVSADQPRPAPRWADWTRHHARIEAVPAPYSGAAPPASTQDTAYAATVVRRTVLGAAGWREPLPPVTVACTLSSTPQGWRVSAVQLSVPGGGG